MNVLKKAALSPNGAHAKFIPQFVAEPLHASERISLHTLSSRLSAVQFSEDDSARLAAHFQNAADKNGYDYDIQLIASRAALRDGVAKVSSSNFGYDFALVNVDAGQGFFGRQKREVRIYISTLHSDEYSPLQTASSLSKALAAIDKLYCEAAALHLA